MSTTSSPLNHAYGCGVAINAPDAVIPIRTLQNLARNPNLGGAVMVVGLGCEKLQPERLLPAERRRAFDDSGIVRLQDERTMRFRRHGRSIMAMAETRLAELDRRRRVTCPASDLVVGTAMRRQRRLLRGHRQSGGRLRRRSAGPRRGHGDVLGSHRGPRRHPSADAPAANEEVARALIREMAWYDRYLDAGDVDRSANPSPGNKKGGLANVVEKALGSIAKSGTSPIVDVLSPGERATPQGADLCRHARPATSSAAPCSWPRG